MGKSLVIVESPAKAKTIGRYLGDAYEVKASVGHIKDLPKRKLGVNVQSDFQTDYEVIPGKEKIVMELRKAAAKADRIYLAADPDREGEAICQHLYDEISPRNSAIYRVMFYEITKDAVRRAFETPSEINRDLVMAQSTRRILDRLVGYKISPLLWRKVRQGLSAGRVQTVSLRLIVDREREIRAFVSEEYWVFTAHLAGQNPPVFRAKAIKLDDHKFKIGTETEAVALRQELETASFVVESIRKSVRKQQPFPPFITSKLQQEANRRFKMTAAKTMQVAQRLYEGVELGPEGSVGLITYMRTDSTRISPAALESARQFIGDSYGADFLPAKPRFFAKSEGAQDAHEAIRPTDVNRTPAAMKPYLGPDEHKLYTLIWQRFVASQMEAALFDHTDVKIRAGRCLFQVTGDVLRFAGFLKVYQESRADDDPESGNGNGTIPLLIENELLKLIRLETEQQFTQPPPRYTEATLIKTLEEKGIGRPSTYASIVSVIQNRQYVTKTEGRFQPTEIGEIVVDLLIVSFPDLFDYQYTATMETHLDLIEQGQQDWLTELRAFYLPFAESLKKAEAEMKNLKREAIPSDEICSQCGSPMVIRWGKYGKFLTCSRFPECKNSRDLAAPGAEPLAGGPGAGEAEAATPPEPCPECGATMVLRKGRFGPFHACSRYPECRTTRKLGPSGATKKPEKILNEACPECGKPLAEKHGRFGTFTSCSGYPACRYIKRAKLDMGCPEPGCKGELVERRSGRGRVFYGCSRYPECKFTSWSKPVPSPCPKCNHPYRVEKETKKSGTILECPAKSCQYKEKRGESS